MYPFLRLFNTSRLYSILGSHGDDAGPRLLITHSVIIEIDSKSVFRVTVIVLLNFSNKERKNLREAIYVIP